MSPTPNIPESVQGLIRERLHSVEELEALLLLRSQPERWWSDGEVAQALRVSSTLARSALHGLVRNGLCHSAAPEMGPTKFEPRSRELLHAVADLGQFYEQHRVEVLVFISQSAISRVRTDALRTFAEAFRFTNGKKDA